MGLVSFLVAFALFFSGVCCDYRVPNACQPIQIPLCKSLPYNMTRLPNLPYHYTQESVSAYIDHVDIRTLINTSCSDSLVFLLCVYHLPICTSSFDAPIPPCRSVCNKVKRECTPTLRAFGRKWPDDVKCETMPTYEKGVCVKPESFMNHSSKSVCKCNKDKSINLKKFRARGYDFALVAQVNDIIKMSNERMIILTKDKLITRGSVKLGKPRLTIYTNSTCACPELQINQTYLLMGHEDTSAGRLILGPQSFVYTWPMNGKKYKQMRRTLRNPMRKLLLALEQEHKRKPKKRPKINLTKNRRKANNT